MLSLGKSYTKFGTGTGLRTSKKSKLSISWGHQSEHLYSLFLFYVQVQNYQNILKLRCWPLAKTFSENKKTFGTSLPASITYLFFLRYWVKCILQLFVSQFLTSQIFEINQFFCQIVFQHDHKSQDKNLNILK